MSSVYLYTLVSVVAVSLVSFVGAFTLGFHPRFLHAIVHALVALAAGALLGDAFLHLLPEVVEEGGFSFTISLAVLAGIFGFFVFEKFLRWRTWYFADHKAHEEPNVKPLAYTILAGDALHNFIDGVVIGASYLVSVPLGIATTLAMVLHEIPQELGDFGVLIHAGFSRGRALLFNFLTALTAIIGGIAVLLIGPSLEPAIPFLIAMTAGVFVYIASTDLIPELHKHTRSPHSFVELLMFAVGIGMMVLLLGLEV